MNKFRLMWRSGWQGRLLMWWQATTEITELTRDRDYEERVIAEAAVRLAPSPSAIALLFRRRPHRRHAPADHR